MAEPESTALAEQRYREGFDDGLADRDPNPDRLAYGTSRLNDYERGYLDSGKEARRG